MAAARGGHATTVKAPKTVVGPQNIGLVGGGIGGTSNPGVPVVNPVTGIAVPVAAPAPAAAPAAAAANPTPATPIDWAAVLAMDPGYTATKAQTDTNIAALNEQYNGENNPFSTVRQLALQLRQGLRSNANQHNAHGTLFGGGTAQGAANNVRDNTKAAYDATNTLNSNIGAQHSLLATELGNATSRVLANPDRYGISSTAPGDPTNVAANQGGAPAPAPAAPVSTIAPGTALPLNDTTSKTAAKKPTYNPFANLGHIT